jgi:hypothetical protein
MLDTQFTYFKRELTMKDDNGFMVGNIGGKFTFSNFESGGVLFLRVKRKGTFRYDLMFGNSCSDNYKYDVIGFYKPKINEIEIKQKIRAENQLSKLRGE